MNSGTTKLLITIAIILVLGFAAYSVLNMPDRRSGTEKLGDAIHELPKGADKAVRQLEDRTPGEKIGDAVEDAGEAIKENTTGAAQE